MTTHNISPKTISQLDGKDDEGISAMMKAAEAGEYQVVQYLIEQGAALDGVDDENWSVLMWAALSGQIEICELLVTEHSIEYS